MSSDRKNPVRRIVETPRLYLREAHEDDAAFIVTLLNEPGFIRYIGDRKVRTLDDARGYIAKLREHYQRHGFGLYTVVLKDRETPIGICGLLKRDALESPDIGFAFLSAYEGHGYAYEAASASLRHAAEAPACAMPPTRSALQRWSRSPCRITNDRYGYCNG